MTEAETPVNFYVSSPEAARMLRLSQQRIRQLCASGELTGAKVGRDWLVHRSSVLARLDAKTPPAE